MFFFDPMYFVFIGPALLLMFWAQWRVKSTYAAASQVPVRMSGAAAARTILDEAGLQDVGIEQVGGTLSDHYDPSHRVLRLSREVYAGNSAASVGIAAHEAGHALQHAQHYAPLVIRNLAVPVAQFGSGFGIVLIMIGFAISAFANLPGLGQMVIWAGILGFGATALFQIINLPVEFDASNRAKRLLYEMGVVDNHSGAAVASVLNAAAWTYVAATLQSIMIVLYYVMRFGGVGSDE